MKKLFAMLMALVMALSCAGVLAEEELPMEDLALNTRLGILVDHDFVKMLAPMLLQGASQEFADKYMDNFLDILEGVYMDAVIGGNVMDLALMANEKTLCSIVAQTDETGVVYVSDLFPHYAVRLNFEDISQAAQAMGMSYSINGQEMSQEEFMQAVAEIVEALPAYGEDLSAYLEKVQGKISISEDGKTMRLSIDSHDVADVLEIVGSRLGTDEVLLKYLPEDAAAQIMQQVEALRGADAEALVNLETTQKDDGMAITAESQGKVRLDAELGGDDTQQTVDVLVRVSAEGTEDWDALYDGLQDGSNMNDGCVAISVIRTPDADGMSETIFGLELMAGGNDFVISGQNRQAGQGTLDFVSFTTLGLDIGMTEGDVLTLVGNTVYTSLPAPVSLEGLTEINLMKASEEEMTALAKDAATYGLPSLLAESVLAMPDQAALLMEMLMETQNISLDSAPQEEPAPETDGIEQTP